MTGCVIERIEKHTASSSYDILEFGDIVRIIGTEKELKTAKIILGEEVKEFVEFHDNMKVLRLLVTSKQGSRQKDRGAQTVKSVGRGNHTSKKIRYRYKTKSRYDTDAWG